MKTKQVATVVLFMALIVALAFQSNRLEKEKAKYALLELQFKQYQFDQIREVMVMNQERERAIEEVKSEAERQIQTIQTDVANAHVAANRLREQLARLRATHNTASASSCQAARAYIGVLTELLAESDDRAGAYAEFADRSRSAGLVCERSYKALTN